MTSASYAPSSASTAATSTTVLTSASVRRRQSFLGIFTSPPRESHDDRRASHKATPRNDLLSLLDSGSGSDVTLIVGSDRVQFTAHCLILRTRSDFFKAELPASAATNSGSLTQLIVELPFLDPDAFRIVLRYIYSLEEDDEATSLDTEDWRLVLACYQAAHHISLTERADIYLQVFTHIFSINDPSTNQGRESACDMWAAASSLSGAEDVVIACAPAFWVLFGSSSGTGNAGLGVTGRQRLADLSLPVLIRVLNAIPEHLESAVGRFRIIKSWFMAQKTLGMFDDEEEDEGFMVGKHYDDCLASPVSDYGDIVRPFSPPTTPTQTPSRLAESNIGTPSSKTSSTVATAFVSSPAPVLKSKESFNNLHSATATPRLKPLIARQPSNLQLQTQAVEQKKRTLNVSLAQQTALQALQLPSLTAADILREIEPADILPQSHILSLYRTAASTPLSASTSWAPVPSGFKGRRCSSWSSRTRWVHVGGSASTGCGNITYCTPEALGQMNGASGGRFTWTVVPLHSVHGVGIGVSADVGVSGGAQGRNSAGISSVGTTDDLLERFESGVSSLFGVPSGPASRRGSVCAGDIGGPAAGDGTGMRFVGDDGGWSLWSDGTLRVGKIFVGRLPKGVTFTRGTNVTIKLDLDARTLGFEVNGVDCGVSFRNLPTVLYPSVVLGDAAAVSISPIKRVF